VVAHALEALLPYEVRYVVLGHVQRGGPPTPFDRVLAARFGVAAIGALAEGEAASMVALRGPRIERVPLAESAGRTRSVDPAGERVQVARSVGTIFGDERA
jgi:6-phosphofructokinase 1